MRILANENLPAVLVAALRQHSHDVSWVHEDAPGSDDRTILERAQFESRVLLTQDKDFGDLAFRSGLPAGCGIVLLRLLSPLPDIIAHKVISALASRSGWQGHFAVIEEHPVRMKTLPRT